LENRSGKRRFHIPGIGNNLGEVRSLAYASLSCCAAVLCVFFDIIEEPADGFLVVVMLLAFHDYLKGIWFKKNGIKK